VVQWLVLAPRMPCICSDGGLQRCGHPRARWRRPRLHQRPAPIGRACACRPLRPAATTAARRASFLLNGIAHPPLPAPPLPPLQFYTLVQHVQVPSYKGLTTETVHE